MAETKDWRANEGIPAVGLAPSDAYRLLIGLIVPRPIAWVGSRSRGGVDNLAPFSFFMGVGSDPPSLAFSVARGSGGKLKDTAANILDTREFTVAIPRTDQVSLVAGSGAAFPPEVSEFERLGMGVSQASRVDAPFPSDASVVLECRLIHALDLGTTHLMVGEIVQFWLDPNIVRDAPGARVDPARLDPLARLDGADYCGIGERLTMPIPKV